MNLTPLFPFVFLVASSRDDSRGVMAALVA
jgi:hypothetical protein